MAKTNQIASTAITGAAALTRQLWLKEQMFREMIVNSYFMPRFASESGNSIIQVQSDLSKQTGDRMYFPISFKLSGAGITGTGTLEGNEESLTDGTWNISLEQYRHAVRDAGALARQRKLYDIDSRSKQAIQDWGAEKIDNLCFNALGPGTGSIYVYEDGGVQKVSQTQATAEAEVEATDKLNLDFISYIKVIAKTGHNRDFNPIQGIMVDGREHYVLLVHPDCLYDLRVDSQFQQAMREAQNRGNSNPLFTGATAIWDNVVIHEHERVPIKTSADANWLVNGAECYFLGKQALVWAWGDRPSLVAENFDYQNEHGYAWGMIAKCDAPYFDWHNLGTNYRNGSFIVNLARTRVSDVATT